MQKPLFFFFFLKFEIIIATLRSATFFLHKVSSPVLDIRYIKEKKINEIHFSIIPNI